MIQIGQGYSILDDVFQRSEMMGVIGRLAADAPQRTRAGARHLLNVPVVRDLSIDSRMLDIARQIVGPAAAPFRATLFDKSPAANWLVVWHQDTALPLRDRVTHDEWGPWSTKVGLLYAHAPAWALEPALGVRTVTRGAMPIAAGVVAEHLSVAVITLREVTTEGRRPAPREIPQDSRLAGEETVPDVGAIRRAVKADDLRHREHAGLDPIRGRTSGR